MPDAGLFYAVALALLALYIVFSGTRIMSEHERLVVFRLGKSVGQRGPGAVFLFPLIDRAVRVSLREATLEMPSLACVTRDQIPVHLDVRIAWKVFDPVRAVLEVSSAEEGTREAAASALRELIGDMPLDDVRVWHRRIAQDLQAALGETSRGWGVEITKVEIREVRPQ